jgi:hypothetical protein
MICLKIDPVLGLKRQEHPSQKTQKLALTVYTYETTIPAREIRIKQTQA